MINKTNEDIRSDTRILYPTIVVSAGESEIDDMEEALMVLHEQYGSEIDIMDNLTKDGDNHYLLAMHLYEDSPIASTSRHFQMAAAFICDQLFKNRNIRTMHRIKHGSNGPEASEMRIHVLSKAGPLPT